MRFKWKKVLHTNLYTEFKILTDTYYNFVTSIRIPYLTLDIVIITNNL